MGDELKFYSLEQVAEMLGVNYQLIYNMVRKGEFPAIRVGKLYRILDSDFREYIHKGRVAVDSSIQPIVCSVCGRSYLSSLSITATCAECGAPICRACQEIKHAKYCEVHEKVK